MNKKVVINTLGRILLLEAALMLLPLAVSFIYKEAAAITAFAVTIAIAAALSLLLLIISRTKNQVIYAKDGFVIVGLAWILMSLIGALPFR